MKALVILASICTLAVCSTPVHGQNPDFISTINFGADQDDAGAGIDVDPSGHMVLTGFFRETVSFGTSQVTSDGIDDVFVARFDADGNPLWVASGGSSSADEGRGVAADSDGNTIATGRMFGTANFGSTEVAGAGSWDAFLVKYDAQGSLQWIESLGGSMIDEGFDVAFDASGNALVTGSFSGDATIGDSVFTSFGQEDMFIAKYDPAGNFIWANRAGGEFFDAGHGIATDPEGNVFVSGKFSGIATFGESTLTSTRLFNGFFAKVDAEGDFQWAHKVGGRDDFSYGIDVDGLGNPVVVGYFQENGVFGDSTMTSYGSSDVYVAKFDTDGDLLWVEQAGSDDSDFGYAVAADEDGNVLITGFFVGTATFSDLPVTSTAFKDVFFARYDADGNLVWVTQAGGGDIEEGLGVAFDASNNMVATGYFNDTITLGSSDVMSTGGSDIFITTYGVSEGSTDREQDELLPGGSVLAQNYPNPFLSTTTIPIVLEGAARVRITVYDLLGRDVARLSDELLPAGRHEFSFDASGLPGGTYFVRAELTDSFHVRRITVAR